MPRRAGCCGPQITGEDIGRPSAFGNKNRSNQIFSRPFVHAELSVNEVSLCCVCQYTNTHNTGESERKKLLKKSRDWPIRKNVTRLARLVVYKNPDEGRGRSYLQTVGNTATHFSWNRQLFFIFSFWLR